MNFNPQIERLRSRAVLFCEARHGNASLLAAEAGVDPSVISKFLKNITTPDTHNFHKIEAALQKLAPAAAPRSPLSAPLIRASVRPDPAPLRVFCDHDPGAVPLPQSLELSETEARLILERRNMHDYNQIFNLLRDEIELAETQLPHSDALARNTLRSIRARLEEYDALRQLQAQAAELKRMRNQR